VVPSSEVAMTPLPNATKRPVVGLQAIVNQSDTDGSPVGDAVHVAPSSEYAETVELLTIATKRPVKGLHAIAYHVSEEGNDADVIQIFPSSEYAEFAEPDATVTNRPVGLHATDLQLPEVGGVAEVTHVLPLSEYTEITEAGENETATIRLVGFCVRTVGAGRAVFP